MAKRKSDTKNVSVVEEKDVKYDAYLPSEKEKEVVKAVFNKFRIAADRRNRNFSFFDGLSLKEYLEDSVQRYTTNVDIREDIEDWQSRVHDPFTRNKVTAILSRVVNVLPIAAIRAQGDEDFRRATIANDLYLYSEELDDYEEKIVDILQEAIVKGTAIGYEGQETKVRKLRDIEGYGEEATIKEVDQKTNRLYCNLVKLEDFYPSSVGIKKIKDMPYCFWRKILPHQQFLQDYSSYPKAAKVQPYSTMGVQGDDTPYYNLFVSNDVGEGNVEVLCYYNQDVDEYVILANGIWLNPFGVQQQIAPLPFAHKTLPFWEIRFESFGNGFFYGKSLPDKLKSMQDVLNVLTNMLLDQSFLTIFPPILTAGFDSIEDDYLRPGRRTPIDTQGLPINQAFMKLDLGTPTGWHQYILDYTRKIMEQSSVDQVTQGVAGVGERTTAREINIAAEGVMSMLGLFGRLVNGGLKRKALLRTKNIMQFWTDEESPIIEKIMGEGGTKEFNKAFNIIRIQDGVMTSGKRGRKVLEMYGKKEDMPTKPENKARADIYKIQTGEEIEIISMPAEYIREFEFDVKMVIDKKKDVNADMEKALALEKVRVYLSFFPELVNKPELLAQLAEKMGDDPAKIMTDNALGLEKDNSQNPEASKPMSPAPQGNTANNAVRGARGGENGAMTQLAQSMTG